MRLSTAFFAACVSIGNFHAVAFAPRALTAEPRLHATSCCDLRPITNLQMSDSAATGEEAATLSDDDWNMIKNLHDTAANGDASLDEVILEALPTIHPTLIMKLRGAVEDSRKEIQEVSAALEAVLQRRMTGARDTLSELLDAGEIRKLDALIGNAARAGKLDVAFFQVLNMNLQAAAATSSSSTDGPFGEDAPPQADQFQILKHIYTRCQEEVEKTIPPGVALLNKLLRTEQSPIRQNQLSHYLCPQPNTIKTPDGKEVELQGREKILVPHKEFTDAIGNAVKQIRTVEKAGGTDRVMAANMVESCRTVAKEARMVIEQNFGAGSDELQSFEENLQPVFRPPSAESEYIAGIAPN